MMQLDLMRSHYADKPTPFYMYDLQLLHRTLEACKREAKTCDFEVLYALKANNQPRILSTISAMGFGADCVSGEEVQRAHETGFAAKNIAFAGVGKTDAEIITALELGIGELNVESFEELKVIEALARQYNKVPGIALRLNPNVPANTHKYITTGLDENKFGMHPEDLPELLAFIEASDHLRFVGVHFHIGSQITDLEGFKKLCVRANQIGMSIYERGFTIQKWNMGGGLGVDYHHPDRNAIPDFGSYFRVFHQLLDRRPGQQVCFELGRSLVAQCGALISHILYVKKGRERNFMVLDAGMTELLRPALYSAYHKVQNLSSESDDYVKYDVVGPVCESSDCFGRDIRLPESQRGDMVAIRTAGAYGDVMASHYNLKKLNPPVFV